ncbi:extracellular solute-binding protein [Paenibacillus sp. LMG 31456]|uniref:Extracellular solute-binding protein n=1 Tax=Paenibacillus foliorum TaxID=2654974 RepID=A0A972GQM1_9BACL|nr:ABC transporter substrate-binding protein [Paenibacillus foliorum]NOU95007.1 extracellular solute-binding protein [Paenibacillus foliorum]
MKKWMSMASVAVLTVSILAGCAGGQEAPKSNAPAPAPQGGKDAPKVTLKLIQNKVEVTEQVKQMAADYTKENPNVTIDAQVVRDLDTMLKTRFASGDEPDIFFAKSHSGVQDWSDRLLDMSNEPWMSKVDPSALPGMTVKGKKLGFPSAMEGYGFVYNKDLFKKAGIDKIPVTITELRQANEKLKAAGIASYAEGYKENFILGRNLFNLPFAYMPDSTEMIAKISSGTAKVQDVPLMKNFFEVLDMTVKYGKGVESVGVSYDNQVADFSSGKTAMMQQGVWTIDLIKKVNPNLNIGLFAVPLTDNPSDTKLPVGIPAYYVINKDSKQVEEAKKFLIWLHKNGQKYLVDQMHFIPGFTDLKATNELGPLAADMNVYLEKKQTIPWSYLLWPAGMDAQFTKPLQAYVGGQLNKDQALEEVQKMWNNAVKK